MPEFLPPELRMLSRQEVAGVMMRWLQPLVVDGGVRTCPGCGAYRDWIVFCLRDNSIWLRCRAGHETKEPGLDAAWFNRHSGPVDRFHPTLEEGLRHLSQAFFAYRSVTWVNSLWAGAGNGTSVLRCR